MPKRVYTIAATAFVPLRSGQAGNRVLRPLLAADFVDYVAHKAPHAPTVEEPFVSVWDEADGRTRRLTWLIRLGDAWEHGRDVPDLLSDGYLRFSRVEDGQPIPYSDVVRLDDPPPLTSLLGRAVAIVRSGVRPGVTEASEV